jgi:hypothetical protein
MGCSPAHDDCISASIRGVAPGLTVAASNVPTLSGHSEDDLDQIVPGPQCLAMAEVVVSARIPGGRADDGQP